MLYKAFIFIILLNYVISLKLIKKKKANFFLNNISNKKYNKYALYNNQSYFGSKYVFNRIFNDNIKQKGDKASELLQRANYVKDINGLFNILPLGLRVINKIIHLINRHLEKLNSHCLSLSILQTKRLWNLSDRSKLYSDEFLYVYKQKQGKADKCSEETIKKKIEDDGNILSPTCEESSLALINQIYNENVTLKSLPILIHQYNYKFRNEKRLEKSLFKSKEFLMKDGYSFHSNEKCLSEIYEVYKECYKNIFEELNLTFNIVKKRKKDKMNALESHEFQVLCRDGKFKEAGHIFKLGDYYSQKLDIKYLNKKNEKKNIFMGSYGIGIFRLLYFLIDHFYDDDGIKLPEQVSPFTIYLIQTNQKSKYSSKKIDSILRKFKDSDIKDDINNKEESIKNYEKNNVQENEEKNGDLLNVMPYNSLNSNDIEYILTLWLYNSFKNNNIDIYYDDTDLHLSRKLKHCDLIGVKNRIIINLNNLDKKIKLPIDFYNYIDSSKNILLNKLYFTFQNVKIEYKNRFSNQTKMMTIHELFKYFKLI
ncbi:proline--tRNA ligase, putative [Plasmodium gallinaceum]|uniref:Proline--tRNA ligase, putative n=1 Tax=Plasmodium gallinaceum TaxID=5849 RepID=A0A1J1GX13_PLAGA|nr:proline--tRNA ligase, putative [Plasmodium gallinaceum]CRG96800.1 proline--tRNA ligase, putative [Plasmodium gallinaceum]